MEIPRLGSNLCGTDGKLSITEENVMKNRMFLMALSAAIFIAAGAGCVKPQAALYDPFDRENPVVKLPGVPLTYVRGHDRGEAIFFDGKTYFREPALTFIPDGKNWVEGTVEFWIKPAKYPVAPQNSQIVLFNWFDWPMPESGYVGEISLTPEGKIVNNCGWEWGGGKPPVVTSKSSVPLDAWTHIAVAWSKAEGYTRIYINDQPDAQIDSYCARASNRDGIFPWLAGYGGYVGALDDLKIYEMPK